MTTISAAEFRRLRTKPPKYRAKPTVVDGMRFASKREAARYQELKLLERAGQIHGLRLQVPYRFTIDTKPMFVYRADFVYSVGGEGQKVEDVKGVDTPLSRLKRKIIEAAYKIVIQVVR